MMGAVSSGGGTLIDHYGDAMGKAGQIAANAVLSGTVDELGGGKFANGRSSEGRPCLHEVCRVVTDEDKVSGAITGAFSIMFNDMIHGGSKKSVMSFKVYQFFKLYSKKRTFHGSVRSFFCNFAQNDRL